MVRIITYGTFDVLHYGHIRLLQRARSLGDYLFVGLSTDEFNFTKGKKAIHSWSERKSYINSLRCVDAVIPESSWDQKSSDLLEHKIDIFVMGSDWNGHFDDLKKFCNVVYLDRTEGISSSIIRTLLP